MSLIHTALVTAAETHTELPAPPWVFGLVFLVVFFVLGVVVWSYRNVANRHGGARRNVAGTGPDREHL